jgi:hypothetical protein
LVVVVVVVGEGVVRGEGGKLLHAPLCGNFWKYNYYIH